MKDYDLFCCWLRLTFLVQTDPFTRNRITLKSRGFLNGTNKLDYDWAYHWRNVGATHPAAPGSNLDTPSILSEVFLRKEQRCCSKCLIESPLRDSNSKWSKHMSSWRNDCHSTKCRATKRHDADATVCDSHTTFRRFKISTPLSTKK